MGSLPDTGKYRAGTGISLGIEKAQHESGVCLSGRESRFSELPMTGNWDSLGDRQS